MEGGGENEGGRGRRIFESESTQTKHTLNQILKLCLLN